MIQKGIIWIQMMIHFIICDNHMMIIRITHHDWSWTIMRQFGNIMMIMILFMMIMMRIMMVHDWLWRIMMIMIRHDWSKNSLTVSSALLVKMNSLSWNFGKQQLLRRLAETCDLCEQKSPPGRDWQDSNPQFLLTQNWRMSLWTAQPQESSCFAKLSYVPASETAC